MGFPAGAQYDSRAPFNQIEHTCPDCNGRGWMDSNDEPEMQDMVNCDTCNGTGIVESPSMAIQEREYEPEDYDRD